MTCDFVIEIVDQRGKKGVDQRGNGGSATTTTVAQNATPGFFRSSLMRFDLDGMSGAAT